MTPSETSLILTEALIVAWFTTVLFSILFAITRLALTTVAAFGFAWRLVRPQPATALPQPIKHPCAPEAPRVSSETQWTRVTSTVARGISLTETLGGLQQRAAGQVEAATYRLGRTARDLAALRPVPQSIPAPAPARPARIAKARDRKLAA